MENRKFVSFQIEPSVNIASRHNIFFLGVPHRTLKEVFVSNSRVHKCEESLLTSTSGFDNYRGLVNLCLVLLVRRKVLE